MEILQDGQEFFKLLLSHLEAKLAKSSDPVRSASTLVAHSSCHSFAFSLSLDRVLETRQELSSLTYCRSILSEII